MMQMNSITGGFLAFFLLFSGCAVEELDDVVVVADVKDEFYLDLWEELGPEVRNLQFQIRTIETEDCQNAYIDYRFRKSGNSFSISLRDIRRPPNCATGPAPAQANIDMGNISPGFYNFTIDLKNTVFNDGRLTALNDRYFIRLETENGVQLVRQELFRIPDGAIWGYAHYESADERAVALAFVNEVRNMGKAASFKAGYYGHFNVGSNGVIDQVHDQPKTGNVQSFLLEYNGDMTELEKIINRYRAQYGANIAFRLYNSKGKIF